MRDETLIARVKERKSAELMQYAAMVRMEPAGRRVFLDIISKLGDQLEACDSLLSGSEEHPQAEKILSPEYRGRLLPSELADEDYFNGCIVHPINPADADLSNYILDLMEKARAVQQGKSPEDDGKDEAIASMRDELKSCRARIDMLTEQLDLAQSEIGVVETERDDLSEELDRARAHRVSVPDLSWVDEALVPISGALDSVVESNDEQPRFYIDKLEQAEATLRDILDRIAEQMQSAGFGSVEETLGKVHVARASVDITLQILRAQGSQVPCGVRMEEVPEEAPAEVQDTPAEEPAQTEDAPEPVEETQEPAEEKEVYDTILSPDDLQILTMVDLMKNSKIDYFVDMSMARRFNEDACEDVITFLKVDLGIIRALLSMDYTSKESIESNFRDILDILETAPEPRHQKMYVNSLTQEERLAEDAYNRIIAKVQDVMLQRYAYLTE